MAVLHTATHDDHHPEAIKTRLSGAYRHSYVGDAVLGAIDGCVTTFAVVAGAVGAGFPNLVALVLGVANLVSDGFSMAVSNYQATKSEQHLLDRVRSTEEHHIDEIPEGEREEIRQIFAAKGFEGDVLEHVVDVITADRKLWVETMIREEWGLQVEGANPLKAAVTTFLAFGIVGLVPLLPFLLVFAAPENAFVWSSLMTAVAFFGVGVVKGHETDKSKLWSGAETLMTGGVAAVLAYLAGSWLHSLYG